MSVDFLREANHLYNSSHHNYIYLMINKAHSGSYSSSDITESLASFLDRPLRFFFDPTIRDITLQGIGTVEKIEIPLDLHMLDISARYAFRETKLVDQYFRYDYGSMFLKYTPEFLIDDGTTKIKSFEEFTNIKASDFFYLQKYKRKAFYTTMHFFRAPESLPWEERAPYLLDLLLSKTKANSLTSSDSSERKIAELLLQYRNKL